MKPMLEGVKTSIKTILRPPILAGWPMVEFAGRMLPTYSNRNMKISWSDTCNAEFDTVLATLALPQGCPGDLYRELLKPGSGPKAHALVTENGEPTALISLRRCKRHWEPVAYQCIPKAIAPAADTKALGRALNGLGVDIRVPAGIIGAEIADLSPRQSWCYECYQVRLQEDFEAHWHRKKRMYTIRRARARCAEMDCSIDGDGDLEWIVNRWHEQWRDDPEQETVATEDRLRFWAALKASSAQFDLNVHSLLLRKGDARVSGVVFMTLGDTAMFMCSGRDHAFDDSYAAAAALLSMIEWTASRKLNTLDLGGGDWKRHWAPVGDQRHGALFRSPLIDAVAWAN